MNLFASRALALSALALIAGAASAQSMVDGVRGSEWSGVAPKSVGYDPTAPNGQFGNPGNANEVVAYDIYFRADGEYVYGLLETRADLGGAYNPGLSGTNLYFSTVGVANSNIGFEFQNDRAFRPGLPGYYNDLAAAGIVMGTVADATSNVFEFAIPQSYLFTDPQNTGMATSQPGQDFRMTLSQSYGYAVAGGQANYGNDRLGRVTLSAPVPEPASIAALGLGGLALLRRRRAAK